MGSKARGPPPHLRRQMPGPGMLPLESFGPPGLRPPHPGAFPFDMLPPPELLEQKLAAQHVEMQRLATENKKLASTHSVLRQELAAAQQELHMLSTRIDVVKADRDQQMRALMEKIAKMEVDLQAAEPMKMEMQQARAEAQNLVSLRQDLLVKVQQLSQDVQRSHGENQQIPALMSELDVLRQEYQHYRATYDYEKKLYNDHLESLHVMEKNYVSMAREVEKLRAELSNASNGERRTGGAYGSATNYKENETTTAAPTAAYNASGRGSYGDGYGTQPQAHAPQTQPTAPAPAPAGRPYEPAAASRPYDPAAPPRPAYDTAPRSGYEAGAQVPYAGYDAVNPYGAGQAGAQAARGGYDSVDTYGATPPQAAAGARAAYDPARPGTQMPANPGNVPQYGGAHPHGGGYEAPMRR